MNHCAVLLLLSSVAWGQSSFSAANLPSSPASSATMATSGSGNRARSLPDLLPQIGGTPTLIGGIIAKTDRVRDEITIQVFGGGSLRVLFDNRTRIDRDGSVASEADLRTGERVYLDTVQAGNSLFARQIRLVPGRSSGRTTGQVVSFDSRNGELVVTDAISPRATKLRIVPTTRFSRGQQAASSDSLASGTLVSVVFLADGSDQAIAQQVSILAAPGNTVVFTGRLVHLDLHLGLLVLVDPRDQKSYEITFDPNVLPVSDSLREGASVVATTSFDGDHYVASAITVDSASKP